MRQWFWLFFVLAIVVSTSATAQPRQGGSSGPWQTYDTSNGEWRSYAGDIGGKKYSPLDQIDAANFAGLEIAWEWTSVDNFVSTETPGGGEWWAPLETIVQALVDESPDLHRSWWEGCSISILRFHKESLSMPRRVRPCGSSIPKSMKRELPR